MKPIKPTRTEREIAGSCLAVRLRMLNRMVTGVYDEALRPLDLRVSQLNILVAIGVRGPLRGVDLAELLRLEKSTLSRDLDRLVARGWVDAAPGKGRARTLTLTDAGRALIERAAPAWREAQGKARALLSEPLAAEITGVVDALWAGPPP